MRRRRRRWRAGQWRAIFCRSASQLVGLAARFGRGGVERPHSRHQRLRSTDHTFSRERASADNSTGLHRFGRWRWRDPSSGQRFDRHSRCAIARCARRHIRTERRFHNCRTASVSNPSSRRADGPGFRARRITGDYCSRSIRTCHRTAGQFCRWTDCCCTIPFTVQRRGRARRHDVLRRRHRQSPRS